MSFNALESKISLYTNTYAGNLLIELLHPRGRFISRSSVLLAFFWRLIDVLLAFFSRLMNVAFSVLFSFLLTFYLHSANRMPIEHKIDVLLAFGLILSLIDIFGLIESK